MRLKLPETVWQALNIPDKGEKFKGRYGVAAEFRHRIPCMYKTCST